MEYAYKRVGTRGFTETIEAVERSVRDHGFVVQEYLPAEAAKKYYRPKDAGFEKNIASYLQKLQSLIQKGRTVEKDTKKKDH